MRFDVADEGFCETARQWLAALEDNTLADLEAVFAASPGYYPTTLCSLWRIELERRGLTACPRPRPKRRNRLRAIPVSHPQDYDWRFTDQTARDLTRCAVADLAAGDTIVHVGTPSTFAVGICDHTDYRHVLVDRNTAMADALAEDGHCPDDVVCVDVVSAEPPLLAAAAAILDPPWYLGDTLAFLAAASRSCREGALLWLCQPTLAARPGVDDERTVIRAELPALGLEPAGLHAAAVRYRMPHFEAMSLRLVAADLPVPPDWRTGDLLVLRKMGALQAPATAALQEGSWHEVRFGPVRIKLRAAGGRKNLGALVPEDVLDTVSRRDPVREYVGLWTSGNRVYSLSDLHTISKLIARCDADLKDMTFSAARTRRHARQLGLPRRTAQKLFDLLLVELQEHLYLEGA